MIPKYERSYPLYPSLSERYNKDFGLLCTILTSAAGKSNEMMEDYTYKTLHLFRENGFECQVLKGGHGNFPDRSDRTAKSAVLTLVKYLLVIG